MESVLFLYFITMKSTTTIFMEAYELLYRYDKNKANKLWDEYYNALEQEHQKRLLEIQEIYNNKMKIYENK